VTISLPYSALSLVGKAPSAQFAVNSHRFKENVMVRQNIRCHTHKNPFSIKEGVSSKAFPDSILTGKQPATCFREQQYGIALQPIPNPGVLFALRPRRCRRAEVDPTCFFICAAFQDLGLVKKYNGAPDRLKWSAPKRRQPGLAHQQHARRPSKALGWRDALHTHQE